MFWTLLLCHLIADYPLQTDAMVRSKKQLSGVAFHVAVHLATMLVIVFGVMRVEWRVALPGVLIVTGVHFAIDLWRNMLGKLKPTWVIRSYAQDQTLHVVSLWLVAYWVDPSQYLDIPAAWVIYLCGYILVTHAWFVTERVLTCRDKVRQQLVNAQLWPRMISRSLFLTLLLLGARQIAPVALASVWIFTWPYGDREEWPRFWMIDIVVATGALLFVLLAR